MSQDSQVIYFRLDCGGVIGFGHLSRCQSIAGEFRDRGYKVSFIIRKRPSLKNFKSEFPVIWLEEAEDAKSQEVTSWLCGSEEAEVQEIKNLNLPSGILFVDHYALNTKWCRSLRESGFYLVKIRDFGNDNYECNLVVDYRYSDNEVSCNVLSGFKYIPLNPEIKTFTPKKTSSLKYEEVGVYLGGVGLESYKKFLMLLEGSVKLKQSRIEWIVPDAGILMALKDIRTDLKIQYSPARPALSGFYLEKDLFIGASGVSFFERAYLNVPQLNFTVADNQKSFAEVLTKLGIMCLIGQLNEDSYESLSVSLSTLLDDSERIMSAALKAAKLISADGAAQICQDIISAQRNSCTQ